MVPEGKNTATITVNNTTYTGLFTPIWDPQYQQWSVGLSALSKDGITLTGRQVEVLTGAQAVKAVAKAIDLGNTKNVTANLTLLPVEPVEPPSPGGPPMTLSLMEREDHAPSRG